MVANAGRISDITSPSIHVLHLPHNRGMSPSHSRGVSAGTASDRIHTYTVSSSGMKCWG